MVASYCLGKTKSSISNTRTIPVLSAVPSVRPGERPDLSRFRRRVLPAWTRRARMAVTTMAPSRQPAPAVIRRTTAGVRSSYAVVTNTLFPLTIGEEQPSPGSFTFHLMLVLSWLHFSGRFSLTETPTLSGPRHWGHCPGGQACVLAAPASNSRPISSRVAAAACLPRPFLVQSRSMANLLRSMVLQIITRATLPGCRIILTDAPWLAGQATVRPDRDSQAQKRTSAVRDADLNRISEANGHKCDNITVGTSVGLDHGRNLSVPSLQRPLFGSAPASRRTWRCRPVSIFSGRGGI